MRQEVSEVLTHFIITLHVSEVLMLTFTYEFIQFENGYSKASEMCYVFTYTYFI